MTDNHKLERPAARAGTDLEYEDEPTGEAGARAARRAQRGKSGPARPAGVFEAPAEKLKRPAARAGTDLEYEDIQELLSRPAASIPGQVSRRAFLGGALATGAAVSMLPSWLDGVAAAATPIGPTDGVLVVIQMGGGNDGLSTLVPMGDSAYTRARGGIAVASPLSVGSNLGLHPKLAKLKARFDAGKVAIVRGVGQTNSDLSHFSSTANWMAGTATSDRTSGWLGRWLDGVSESAEGLRAVQLGTSVPLHMLGRSSVVTAMDTGGDLFGADRSEVWMPPVYDAVASFGASTTGKGLWADKLAASGRSSVDLATKLSPLYSPAFPDSSLASQLTLAARLINANLGIRVISCAFGSFDTHDNENYAHPLLMQQFDDAIDAFYKTLSTTFGHRVSLMTFSEFGRRVDANASGGTDHGTASVHFVIGDNVKGGLYGQQPSLTDLDWRGDLKVKVDFRSYYASVLGPWLGGDVNGVMGSSYEVLPLFAATAGKTPVPPPGADKRWLPFATPSDLVRQQYLDVLARPATPAGVTSWTNRLVAGQTIPSVIQGFLTSTEFVQYGTPAARLALVGLGGLPAFDDLMAWTAMVRAKSSIGSVAALVAAKPAFAARYGKLSNSAFVSAVYLDVTGVAAPASFKGTWVGRLDAKTATRAAVLAYLCQTATGIKHLSHRVEVLMTYATLLRRCPSPTYFASWVSQLDKGASLQRVIAGCFGAAEYSRRFS